MGTYSWFLQVLILKPTPAVRMTGWKCPMDPILKKSAAAPSLDPSPALDQPWLSGCTLMEFILEQGSEPTGGTTPQWWLMMTSSGWGITPWWTAATGPLGFQCQVSLSLSYPRGWTTEHGAGLLNSRPKFILAGWPAKIGRNWLKLVEIGWN